MVDTDTLYSTSRTNLIVLLSIAILVGASAAAWIVMSISRGLSRAGDLMLAVAEGDLTQTAQLRNCAATTS